MPELELPQHMVTGPWLFGVLAAGIVFIVIATTRFRLHPFLALIVTALAIGLTSGLTPAQTVLALTGGFGRTVSQIGIVIGCGCIIGIILEKSGCALVMANTVLRLIGRTRALLAMSCTGALVSVPVFCDSGYVILSPLNRSLARRTKQSMATFSVALSMGLYATHCLVPPTPGPVAAAGELHADVGRVILLGSLVVIPVLVATLLYARFAGRRIYIEPPSAPAPPVTAADSEASRTPGALAAFSPIMLPVVLIAAKSVAELPPQPFGQGFILAVLSFAGDPVAALVIGVFIASLVARGQGRDAFGSWCSEGLREAGTIILITAAGGALGGVLRETRLASLLGETLVVMDLGSLNILLPFLVAVGLKTALGSSTVAMIMTSSLIAPLLGPLGMQTGYGPALTTLAVASGAMIVSHVNDSYFWVVTQMSGLSVAHGYRLITVASAVAGVSAMASVFLLHLLLSP